MTPALFLAPLVMGLLGSTHCGAMCGGIAATLTSALPPAVRASPLRQLPYGLSYSGGRVTSYAIAGAVAGSMGGVASEVLAVSSVQIALRLLAGILMIGIGLFLIGWLPSFAVLERLGGPLWSILRPYTRRLLPVRSVGGAWLLGMLWGWLPCGLVYVALTLALGAGSPLLGALTMASFGLGTLPAMVAVGTFAGTLQRWMRQRAVRVTAASLLAALGALNVSTAWAQGGLFGAAAKAPHACCADKHSP